MGRGFRPTYILPAMPVSNASSPMSRPAATVPGTGGRLARPSLKNGLASSALYLGCRRMSEKTSTGGLVVVTPQPASDA